MDVYSLYNFWVEKAADNKELQHKPLIIVRDPAAIAQSDCIHFDLLLKQR